MPLKIVLISLVIFQIHLTGAAQDAKRFDFFIGYGFYEGFHIGSEYYFKSYTHSVSLSFGYDRLFKQENVALSAGYNFAIFKNHKSNSGGYKWRVNNKVVLWQLNDEYYLWRAVSLIPSLNRRFILNRNLSMSFGFGPSFNIVLYNRRKTFREVGWPYHVMPDFSILFIF